MGSILRIGTRGSHLAMWQARTVATALESHGVDAELVIIKTAGDRQQEAALAEVGGKGLFVKEIEEALLAGEVDLAVHSAKDMPAVLPPGLEIGATLPREDPRDVIVLGSGERGTDILERLGRWPAPPRIGTSSVRRSAQLRSRLPKAAFLPIRGNVDTRLRKLHDGHYDALVLAAAGMRRLGFAGRISGALAPEDCVPAPGQGIVAVEIRSGDVRCREAVRRVHDETAAAALEAERTVVEKLGGGCQLPLGALARIRGHEMDLLALVCSPDGARVLRAREGGAAADARGLGEHIARQLIAGGAAALLDEIRSSRLEAES
jgi:hydroxymethylbilane synthase